MDDIQTLADAPSGTKDIWFRQGAKAISRYCDLTDSYVCPLCLRWFPQQAVEHLSREHVPPRKLGGEAITLTCRDCNSTAGSTIDSHAVVGERALEFGLGALKEPSRARFGVGGVEQRGEVTHDDGNMRFVGVPRANDPRNTEQITTEMEKWTTTTSDDGHQLKVTLDSFSPKAASVSWLRSGYLALFAALGYGYILGESLAAVREQIRYPDQEILDSYYISRLEADTTERAIILITDPDWVDGISVNIGRHLILLPFGGSDTRFYDRVGEKLVSGVVKFTGCRIEWPESPQHVWDTDPE